MSAPQSSGRLIWGNIFILFGCLLCFFHRTTAADSSLSQYVSYTNEEGQTIWLVDDRKPALYTQNFGDCHGDSLINVTRFDAAYYADNMTVVFHLAGASSLTNQSLMCMLPLFTFRLLGLTGCLVYIGVFAYGEQRFELTFNPCSANILSLCPLNASVPIEASGIIPVAPSDVSGIPSIALTIPDFEGQAILRIFANSTESQIACFSAVVTNGNTFSHPAAIGTILGLFAAVALVSSVASAAYGDSVSEARKYYAHSISVFVVFSVFQHIFFTGGLSVNWPSVLPAFWSNYAWAAGMIYSDSMQNSINRFIGSNRGNISIVGAAPSGVDELGLGGIVSISQIYSRLTKIKRFQSFNGVGKYLRPGEFEHTLARRDLANSSTGFSWYGRPVRPGLPLPGNYSGFAGTLSEENIPASNAFLTGLLWLLILVAFVAAGLIATKWILDGLFWRGVLKTQRLAYFRKHWVTFTVFTILRICIIAFFMMVFLTTFQFALGGSAGVIAIAAVVLVAFVVGMSGSMAYALFYRLRGGHYAAEADKIYVERRRLGFLPWYGFVRESNFKEQDEAKAFAGSLPWWRITFIDDDAERVPLHDDEDYTRKFGWLSSRFRLRRWWFFVFWTVYELVRAAFYGGAAGNAFAQVFGLLAVEFVALVTILYTKPFQSSRLNIVMAYLLGFSKVSTVALASAFDTRFGLNRITTTAIGIVIIAIQGLLTIGLMLAIVLGAISTYMSLTRNREEFRPIKWAPYRIRFFAHVEQRATDIPVPRLKETEAEEPAVPPVPYFKVTSVRREPKIEDEDEGNRLYIADFNAFQTATPPSAINSALQSRAHSRPQSLRSRSSVANLPYGARPHRSSWSSRDLQLMAGEAHDMPLPARVSIEETRCAPTRQRPASQRLLRTETPTRLTEGAGTEGGKAPRRRNSAGAVQTRDKL